MGDANKYAVGIVALRASRPVRKAPLAIQRLQGQAGGLARKDELAFGISVEPDKWIPTVDEWIARWKQDRHALAIMPPGRYDALAAQGVPMKVIARDNRRVIVEKPQS